MATVHRLPHAHAEPESVLTRLTRLLKLEVELGVAETRELLRAVVFALAVALPSAIALIASSVVLIAAAFAPLVDAPWAHLVIAGGGVFVLALVGIAWSIWRVKSVPWPKETLRSFEENWRWLGAQLRSRLTLP